MEFSSEDLANLSTGIDLAEQALKEARDVMRELLESHEAMFDTDGDPVACERWDAAEERAKRLLGIGT